MSGSIMSFLIYNFSPAKIFMGDTGSLLLGLVNSILVIKFINSTGTGGFQLTASPAIGFAILIVPLFDTLRVFGLRILDRRSPFSPDRNHVHHFLLDLGFSHKKITISCVAINILFISMAYLLRDMGTTIVVAILLFCALSIISYIYYLRQKIRQTYVHPKPEAEMIKSHKILGLVPESVEAD